MIDEMSWAKQNARNSATDGRSLRSDARKRQVSLVQRGEAKARGRKTHMKKNECERVTKMSACEIWATWR